MKLVTLVEGDQKASFSIATTPRSRGRRYSLPWIAPLYPWYVLILLSVKQGGIKYNFLKFLIWRDLGLNPDLPDHWRTLYQRTATNTITISSITITTTSSTTVPWDCEIQTDHLILIKRPDLELINKKKNLPSIEFCYSSGQHRENERN